MDKEGTMLCLGLHGRPVAKERKAISQPSTHPLCLRGTGSGRAVGMEGLWECCLRLFTRVARQSHVKPSPNSGWWEICTRKERSFKAAFFIPWGAGQSTVQGDTEVVLQPERAAPGNSAIYLPYMLKGCQGNGAACLIRGSPFFKGKKLCAAVQWVFSTWFPE